jgi:hypothetical protein
LQYIRRRGENKRFEPKNQFYQSKKKKKGEEERTKFSKRIRLPLLATNASILSITLFPNLYLSLKLSTLLGSSCSLSHGTQEGQPHQAQV